jgi:hypothetical protein
MRFEFGKGLFNGIEIRAVGRQVTDANSLGRENPGHVLDFVGGEVIEDERVARAQLWTEHALQISGEDLGIDRSFDQKWSGDAVMAQGRYKSGALPVAVRDGTETPLTNRAAAMKAGQLGVQTCFIDKHKLADIPARLLPTPKLAGGFDIRPILLGGARRFFYSSGPIVPAGATMR